ncbi:hypothetical protein K7432_010954 [Basidiobolus ranarum]|uniref:Uncharacterized protein n=1 Tax=Basidiobolus ranarum TaxID=34480 RepID=A0ABR2WMY9_9FUNG
MKRDHFSKQSTKQLDYSAINWNGEHIIVDAVDVLGVNAKVYGKIETQAAELGINSVLHILGPSGRTERGWALGMYVAATAIIDSIAPMSTQEFNLDVLSSNGRSVRRWIDIFVDGDASLGSLFGDLLALQWAACRVKTSFLCMKELINIMQNDYLEFIRYRSDEGAFLACALGFIVFKGVKLEQLPPGVLNMCVEACILNFDIHSMARHDKENDLMSLSHFIDITSHEAVGEVRLRAASMLLELSDCCDDPDISSITSLFAGCAILMNYTSRRYWAHSKERDDNIDRQFHVDAQCNANDVKMCHSPPPEYAVPRMIPEDEEVADSMLENMLFLRESVSQRVYLGPLIKPRCSVKEVISNWGRAYSIII